jgi:hypothetical protein
MQWDEFISAFKMNLWTNSMEHQDEVNDTGSGRAGLLVQ